MHIGYEAAFQNREQSQDDIFVQSELAACVRAESLGFESVWLTEHHFSNYGLIPDPLLALSYIGAKTNTIKLGTAVVVLPWHDPVRITEQIILADHLTNGRMLLGIGRGLAKYEFDGLRIPQEESRSRFDESARLVLESLETGVIEGGQVTRQPRREIRPRPLKSFSGRVFSASVSPQSASIVASLGVAPMFIVVKPPDLLGVDMDRFRGAWRTAHGIDSVPPGSLLSVVVMVDESADRAAELAKKYGRSSHRVAVEHYGMADHDFGTVPGYEYYRHMRATPDLGLDLPPSTVLYGTPDQVLERFAEFKKYLDMQGVLVIFHGMPFEDGERNMQCFVKHCMPVLKSWPARTSF